MPRLSKTTLKLHDEAVELLKNDILTNDQKIFVLKNYHESINADHGRSGCFFTPNEIAYEFIVNSFGYMNFSRKIRVLDLGAGIGCLSRTLINFYGSADDFDIVCVEINPEHVAVGKKIVPEAKWYCADALDLDFILSLGYFDFAISNPPFGNVPSVSNKETFYYSGTEGEYKFLDVASVVANNIAFILPQSSAGYKYSGVQCYEEVKSDKYLKFVDQTRIKLDCGIPIDTSSCGVLFKNTSITVEFVLAETDHIKADLLGLSSSQQNLF